MKILVTGAAGFLGQRLAKALLTKTHELVFEKLVLVDIVIPIAPNNDKRVCCQMTDLTKSEALGSLLETKFDIIFHLAAVVSGHAEADFDLGWKVNLDLTRNILETTRKLNPECKLVFTSTAGVYGGELPEIVSEGTAVTPVSSYGTQKAMSELMINDYTRKGFIDGRVVRLPTITVRAGAPNQALTSFASGIIREPLNGKEAVCPVRTDLKIYISSPETVVKNFIHAATVPADAFGDNRTVNLPGITVTVQEMIDALAEIRGPEVIRLIHMKEDEAVNRILECRTNTRMDTKRAINLGFSVDKNIQFIIESYIKNELK